MMSCFSLDRIRCDCTKCSWALSSERCVWERGRGCEGEREGGDGEGDGEGGRSTHSPPFSSPSTLACFSRTLILNTLSHPHLVTHHSHPLSHTLLSHPLTLTHPLSHTHSHTPALTHSLSHTRSHTPTLTHSLSHTHSHTLTLTHSLSHTHSHTPALTHSLSHTRSHTLPLAPRDTKVWSTRGVEGVHRFLARAYRLFEGGVSEDEPAKDQMRLLHATIKKVIEEGQD
jgi:hypothetical protein